MASILIVLCDCGLSYMVMVRLRMTRLMIPWISITCGVAGGGFDEKQVQNPVGARDGPPPMLCHEGPRTERSSVFIVALLFTFLNCSGRYKSEPFAAYQGQLRTS